MTRKFHLAALVVATLALVGCDRAPSNVKTMQTTNCGQDWIVIKPGERIPSTSMNVCAYNTVLPDYPMQGDTEFLTQFIGNILVKTRISYDYEIKDGLKFLKVAKFLGKASGSAQAAADGTKMGQFETAENVVIDVALREIVTAKTVSADIVTFNPSQFEDWLLKEANKVLAERGVELNSMTFVTIPEDQTRMSIDAATAMLVYKSKNMEELGRQLVIARAGATQVRIDVTKEGK